MEAPHTDPEPAPLSDVERMRGLVARSDDDPLAPFALRTNKRHIFATNGRAGIGYRIRMGTAVAGGDPVGDPDDWAEAIRAFVAMARAAHLRIAVLGAGERARPLWEAYQLSGVPIGRDVVLDVPSYSFEGRSMRNARQAVKRADNAGVTVEISTEGDLRPSVAKELRQLRSRTHNSDRGFSMLLGNLLDGTHPDEVIAIARNRQGQAIAFQRYLRAGTGLSLDIPLRDPNAPNGVDERIIASMVEWGRLGGYKRISLAFAPFPELFHEHSRPLARLGYYGVHLLDPLIRVESLYQFLRKFHAFDQQRFVMFRWRQIVPVAFAMLLLEFSTGALNRRERRELRGADASRRRAVRRKLSSRRGASGRSRG